MPRLTPPPRRRGPGLTAIPGGRTPRPAPPPGGSRPAGTDPRAEARREPRAEPRERPCAEPCAVRATGPGADPGPRSRGGPRPGSRTGIGVPAFAHPLVAPTEWAELARPGAPLDWAAFDVARGPGSRPDPLYGEALARVRENTVPVLGLLDTARGARPFGDLVSDASRHLDWYRVDGFYLHRAPTEPGALAECRRLVLTLRALLDGGGPIVLAPGGHPDPRYAEIGDQLVTFAGPWTAYRWSEAPQWTAGHPPSRFAHLVHGVPAPHLDTALRIARWQGAGTVFLTDRDDRDGADPWAGLPRHWHEKVQKVRNQPPPSM